MPVVSLFPTLIYEHQGTMQEIFLVQDEIRKKLPIIEQTDIFNNPPGWEDGVQTNIKSRTNSIKDFELTHLKKYIETHVKKYIDQTQSWHPVPIALRHSWINKTGRDQGQEWHQHSDAFISGTYYYQTTGNDGNFSLMNAIPWMQQELFPFGNIAEKYYDIKPAVGKLLLFPGWLQHSVKRNKTDDFRISISFNLLRDYWKNGDSQDVGYI
jgi:uncharacterized protein (TIGR02466 family)